MYLVHLQDLAKQDNESKKPKQPKDESKEPKWCPIIYLDDPMAPGEVLAINIKNAYEKPDACQNSDASDNSDASECFWKFRIFSENLEQ